MFVFTSFRVLTWRWFKEDSTNSLVDTQLSLIMSINTALFVVIKTECEFCKMMLGTSTAGGAGNSTTEQHVRGSDLQNKDLFFSHAEHFSWCRNISGGRTWRKNAFGEVNWRLECEGLVKGTDYTCNKSSCVLWSIFPAVFRSVKGQRSLFESEMSLKGQTAAAQTACLQTADASSLIAFG